MGSLHLGGSALLPGLGSRQGCWQVFNRFLLSRFKLALCLADLGPTLCQNHWEDLGEITNEVKTVGHLKRLRGSLSSGFRILAGAIAADHFDLRMRAEPVRKGGIGAIG